MSNPLLEAAALETEVVDVVESTKRLNRRALIARRFLRNRLAVFGLVMYLLLILVAIFGPVLIEAHQGWRYDTLDRTAFLQPPSAQHWLGTTQPGGDVLAMTLAGLRKSMLISLVVGLCSTALAAVVGSFAAYFKGRFESAVLWVIDLLLVLPSTIIIAVVMRNVTSNGTFWLIFWLTALGWMLSARVVRSLTQSVRDREYVLAAKYMGVSSPRIIFRHVLPNISSLLIIDATLGIAGAVLAETGLSFLGFGIRPPDVSLGTVIQEGARMATTFPWIFIGGAVPLVLMVLAVNFIGDGLRDALDPTSGAGGTG